MTTIAFDGKILAADRAITWGDQIGETTSPKMIIRDDMIAFGSGDAGAWRSLACWHIDNPIGMAGWRHPPPIWGESGYGVYILGRNGEVYCIDKFGTVLRERVPLATGSGCEIAIGALHAGATAVEAVRIACRLDKNSRGPIDYVLVDADPWVIRQAPDRPAWDGNYTFPVRREGDGLDEVRLAGRANGGSAPHSPHEGQA